MAVMTPAEFAAAFGLVAPASTSGLPAQPGQYITYTTTAGDRWDTIAWEQYGDATQITALIMANPAVAIVDVFDPGVQIAIPLIAAPAPPPSTSPPWAS
jgi:phage tail protein X